MAVLAARQISFPGRVEKVQNDVAKIISAIHKSEQVELFVLDGRCRRSIQKITWPGRGFKQSNFPFCRIFGRLDAGLRTDICQKPDSRSTPLSRGRGNLTLVKWIFNQWGGKFPDLLPDDALPYKIKSWLKLKMEQPELVLEGGAIDVNGQECV